MINRWTIAIAASIVMLVIGTIYAWSIFTQPLIVAFHWDLTTTTAAYAIANFCLAAVGAVFGGFWQDRAGPRRVAMVGVTLWGLGNVLAGIGTPALGAPWLYATYGILGGLGAGMAYITPLAVVAKWFPDRRGLAGGLVVGGFGLGAFVYSQWIPRLTGFHAVAVQAGKIIAARAAAATAGTALDPQSQVPPQAFAASDIDTLMRVFIISGVVFLIVGLPAASLLRDPPRGCSGERGGSRARKPVELGYSPSQVLKLPQFYLLWLQLFANVIAGITIISNAVFILADITRDSPAAIAPLFGIVSIFNAVGRFLWGGLSDRIGCSRTFAAMFAVQATTLFSLGYMHDLGRALGGISLVLLCCGGGFGTMPSYSAQYFGTKYMGLNYGMVLTAWGFAALIGPVLVARVRDLSGSFEGMLPMIAIALLASVILPLVTRRPAPAIHNPAAA